jgi:hypothetical protein
VAAWDRKTPWCQGHVLTAETLAALQLVGNDSLKSVAVVISHDCDLAQLPAVEPFVELIVGQRVGLPDGNLTRAKNPRRVHLPATEGGETVFIELTATERRLIPKTDFAEHLPSSRLILEPNARNVLQHWLAARYRRSAFPDLFDEWIFETGVGRRLAKILEPLGTHIIAIFFDVDEGLDRQHLTADDPYMLSIILLYSTESDPRDAESAAQSAVESIETAFRDRYLDKTTGTWKRIELLDCTAVADQAMTYAMSLKLKRWNADYISLRAEPAQPALE